MTNLENLLICYNMTPEGDIMHVVLHNFLLHLNELEDMSVERLAEISNTSVSTISRLVKKLGYRSYPAMIQALQDSIDRYHNDNRILQPDLLQSTGLTSSRQFVSSLEYIVNGLRDSAEDPEIPAIAEELHNAKCVSLFPYGNHLGYESMLQSDLFISGIPCDIIIGDSEQIDGCKKLTENSVAMFLYPGAADGLSMTKKKLTIAKERGAKIILLTLDKTIPLKELPDHILTFPGINRNAIDYMGLVSLVGMITLEYRTRYIDS